MICDRLQKMFAEKQFEADGLRPDVFLKIFDSEHDNVDEVSSAAHKKAVETIHPNRKK